MVAQWVAHSAKSTVDPKVGLMAGLMVERWEERSADQMVVQMAYALVVGRAVPMVGLTVGLRDEQMVVQLANSSVCYWEFR